MSEQSFADMAVQWEPVINALYPCYQVIQGGFFDCSALKMTKCQPLKEFSELVLPKKRLGMKKFKVPELVLLYSRNCSDTLIFSVKIF